MPIPVSWLDGYIHEGTFNTSPIDSADDIMYRIGLLGDRAPAQHPSPIPNLKFAPVAVGTQEVAAGRVWKTSFTAAGNYSIGVVNGVLCQIALGESTTTDDSPSAGYNTHAIAPKAPVAGSIPAMDSITWHHEKLMSDDSVLTVQFTGMKAASLTLIAAQERKYLLAKLGVLSAGRAKKNFDLDVAPAFPATANPLPFMVRDTILTFDTSGTPINISEYMRNVEVEISPNLEAIMENRSMDPAFFAEGWMKDYTLRMDLIPYSLAIWDELVATGNTKDMTVKFVRNSTTDYILATLTDVTFIEHTIESPAMGEEEVAHIEGKPRTLRFSVVDKLEGSAYNK